MTLSVVACLIFPIHCICEALPLLEDIFKADTSSDLGRLLELMRLGLAALKKSEGQALESTIKKTELAQKLLFGLNPTKVKSETTAVVNAPQAVVTVSPSSSQSPQKGNKETSEASPQDVKSSTAINYDDIPSQDVLSSMFEANMVDLKAEVLKVKGHDKFDTYMQSLKGQVADDFQFGDGEDIDRQSQLQDWFGWLRNLEKCEGRGPG